MGFIQVRRQKRIASRILREPIGLRGAGIDADSTVGDLSGGERQGIAIDRAMDFARLNEVRTVLDVVAGSRSSAAPASTSSTTSPTSTNSPTAA